jgi:AcrR family transcriptional regulator
MARRTKRPYRRAEQTREQVLAVAERLFHADGIRAVGVDRLAREAKVTTTTLYRLFGSKEGLVAAYLRRQDEGWFDWLEGTAGRDGLAHFFEELDEQAREADYRGCPFRMALAEYPSRKSEVHRIAVDNKLQTRERFRALASEAGAPDPDTVADQLVLLADGICASAAERTPDSPAGAGPKLARDLLGAG